MFKLYRSEIDNSGTLIVWRMAFRWGVHRGMTPRGEHFQWYGRKGWYFFL